MPAKGQERTLTQKQKLKWPSTSLANKEREIKNTACRFTMTNAPKASGWGMGVVSSLLRGTVVGQAGFLENSMEISAQSPTV